MKRAGGTPLLFPDDEEEEDEPSFPSGSSSGPLSKYAERYDKWRTQEELMKMKARHGTTNLKGALQDLDSSSSEESSSEGDWTEDKEKAFFKTLSVLKKKDPRIYDPAVTFFKKEDKDGDATAANQPKEKKKKAKPFLLKDHERKMILERGDLLSSDEEEDGNVKKQGLSYYQELDEIKRGISDAMKGIGEEEDGEEGSNLLLKGKKKISEEDKKKDEEDYKLWLKGELERIGEEEDMNDLSFLRSYWTEKNLDEGEKYLRDYILNRKYVDLPSASDNKKKKHDEEEEDDQNNEDDIEEEVEDDEQFDEKREEFEHKYNFRFEEPDPEFIKRFPRTIEESMRRESDRRKKSRESTKERKKEEKKKKREEVQRLKALKKREIEDKIKRIEQIGGVKFDALQERGDDDEDDDDDVAPPHLVALLDGDFDPEEYDKQMRTVYNEGYDDGEGEGAEDEDQEEDDKKPEFPFDPEIDDEPNWEEWAPSEEEEELLEDQESIKKKGKSSSAVTKSLNSPPSKRKTTQDDLIAASSNKKSKNIQSKFAQVISKKKPKYDPKKYASYEEYWDEFYALDFEDVIAGGLTTRFKYRHVPKNDFGLSTEEILTASDKELNQWASLKKTYQHRPENEEIYEAKAYEKKGRDEKLKKRVLASVYQPKPEIEDSDDQGTTEEPVKAEESTGKKKRKKKKKKTKKGSVDEPSVKEDEDEHDDGEEEEEPTKTKVQPEQEKNGEPLEKESKRKKKNQRKRKTQSTEVNGDTNKVTNHPPKKKKKSNSGESKAIVEDERLKAYGVNPTKFKKWVKYGGGGKQKR